MLRRRRKRRSGIVSGLLYVYTILALLLSAAMGVSAEDRRVPLQHLHQSVREDVALLSTADVLRAIMNHEFWFPQRAIATKKSPTAPATTPSHSPSPSPSPSSRPTPKPSVEPKDAGYDKDQEDDQLRGTTATDQSGSNANDEAAVSVWTPTSITQDNIRIALDAVRYRNNYEKYITTRLCLHRINLIRSRQVDDLTSFLFSVDGCESAKIIATGRCDIYYCKLATYELKVTQKTTKKDIYIVQSIFKALSQKSMSELMQPSNLDFTDPTDDGGDDDGAGDGSANGGNRNENGNTKERALAQAGTTKGDESFSLSTTISVSVELSRTLRLSVSQALAVSQSDHDHSLTDGENTPKSSVMLVLIVVIAVVATGIAAVVVRQRTRYAQRRRLERRRSRRRHWSFQPLASPLSESSGLLKKSGTPSQLNGPLDIP